MTTLKDYAKIGLLIAVAIVVGFSVYKMFAEPAIASYNAGKSGAATA